MKLFVGGLQYDMHEDVIKAEFEKYGTVESIELIKDRKPGNNKGFGYVIMADDDQANKAIEGMNGMEFNGKTLKVSVALDIPREPRPERPNKPRGNKW